MDGDSSRQRKDQILKYLHKIQVILQIGLKGGCEENSLSPANATCLTE